MNTAKLANAVPFGDANLFNQNASTEIIQKQLEGDNPTHKLEALKRIIAMISRGKDCAELFPSVVKNVISHNLETKKLVYIILCYHAEQKPDEALLSIAHFQKDMTDKNQFIRASALRVMSSIRVDLITQIVMIAIRKCASDSSPYVRKVAAIAIPKVFSMNEEERDSLISILEQLIGDNNTIVLGAAVYAYNEICPDRFDLLHPHYRKLCKYLVDCDEWGQIYICNVLLRYARTQFLSPFKEGWQRRIRFYDEDEEEEEGDENLCEYDMDPDHRLLLKASLPLLQSINTATVLSVASLYYHLAPPAEFGVVVKSLMMIIRGSRESGYVVLSAILNMAVERPAPFHPHLKTFFVNAGDPPFTRELKIKILAALANDTNALQVLREYRTYVKHTDTQFVCEVVQAIGRVASEIPEESAACLQDLLTLINHRTEEVVAETIVTMRHLLQKAAAEEARTVTKVIRKLAALIDTVTVPVARASIIWLVGEFYTSIPQYAPDVFRKLASTFVDEDHVAKLQILSLGTKLYLSDFESKKVKETVHNIFQYVLQLGRYDANYDIRDRTRIVKALLFSDNLQGEDGTGSTLRKKAKELLMGDKQPPDFDQLVVNSAFQLGSLSHIMNHTCSGYSVLPDFPETEPPKDVRNTTEDVNVITADSGLEEDEGFYGEEEEWAEEEEEEEWEEEEEEWGEEEEEYEEVEEIEEEVEEEEPEAAPKPREKKENLDELLGFT